MPAGREEMGVPRTELGVAPSVIVDHREHQRRRQLVPVTTTDTYLQEYCLRIPRGTSTVYWLPVYVLSK